MQISASGILCRSQTDTPRACLTFPAVIRLANGSLIATWRAGSTKDSSDETIEMARSHDGGFTWSAPSRPFAVPTLEWLRGSLRLCYLTELEPGKLLAASMWVDRTTYPGRPLFNEETEGCLPMSILIAESTDDGHSWSPWRIVPVPEEIGPASLTNPILKLDDGSIALSVETNKHYADSSPWLQKVVFFHSADRGLTWGSPIVVGEDPTGRVFNWDLRCGVAPDGRVASFAWTWDAQAARYLNIQRRVSPDHGRSWSEPQDLGFSDQPARPAVLADGRTLLPYVDRFNSHTIRARLAADIGASFEADREVVIYIHGESERGRRETRQLLSDMGLWSFGLPYAETLSNGSFVVVYYAGSSRAMDIRWAHVTL